MILLDTHIFVWLNLHPEKISERIFKAVSAEERWGVSPITFWEIGMLSARNRIELPLPPLEWLREAVNAPRVEILPITIEIAVRSGTLDMHGDPADRLIAATSLEHACRVATVDSKLTELPFLKTVR